MSSSAIVLVVVTFVQDLTVLADVFPRVDLEDKGSCHVPRASAVNHILRLKTEPPVRFHFFFDRISNRSNLDAIVNANLSL